MASAEECFSFSSHLWPPGGSLMTRWQRRKKAYVQLIDGLLWMWVQAKNRWQFILLGEPEDVRRVPLEEQSFGLESGHPLVCQKKCTGVKISTDPWTCSRSKVWRGTDREVRDKEVWGRKVWMDMWEWACSVEILVFHVNTPPWKNH